MDSYEIAKEAQRWMYDKGLLKDTPIYQNLDNMSNDRVYYLRHLLPEFVRHIKDLENSEKAGGI